MPESHAPQPKHKKAPRKVRGAHITIGVAAFLLAIFALYILVFSEYAAVIYTRAAGAPSVPQYPRLNTATYNLGMLALAHIDPSATTLFTEQNASSTLLMATSTASSSVSILGRPWPAAAAYPENGAALLPAHRIVAYYGNFYSTQMGVLGAYPPDQVLAMLASTTEAWQAADPSVPVIPAIDYIAVTAQASPGADGMYRARMPASQIEQALSMANQVHGLLFLDIQVGLSNVETEVPLLEQYLKLPNVELSIDPEFSMKDGVPPGREIGTYDASDINWSANYLASLVKQYDLPPKLLVVHRFTEDMVTNYKQITPLPQVQVVMDMDGWGDQPKKINTYERVIEAEPVQFTGFKLFYKNDLKPPSTGLLTPEQVIDLTPSPSYIQYQ